MNADTLHQAIAAARDGRRDDARALLLHLLEADPRNERAWLWLSGVVDDPEDVKICLENVLALNPSNPRARQGLEWLHARMGLPLPPLPPPDQTGRCLEREIDTHALSVARLRAYRTTLAVVEPVAPPRPKPDPISAPVPSTLQNWPVATRANPAPTLPTSAPAPATVRTAVAVPSTDPARHLASVAPADDATIPCPYCGAPTVETQRRCAQCGGSLLVRVAPSDEQSPIVQALVWMWRGGAVAVLLIALVFPVMGVFLYQEAPANGFPIGILIPSVILAPVTITGFSVAQQLAQRSTWALYLAVGLTTVGLIGALALAVRPDALIGMLNRLTSATSIPSTWLLPLIAGARLIAIGAGVAHIATIALTIVGYDAIVGRLERFRYILKPSDHLTHYNNGVALKNRGMWYVAALEWEWAVKKAPYDVTYLRALGLAYARLKQFDKAQSMIDRALQAAPDNPRLREDRALIERLASQEQR
ncbi:MAG: tetratricopeptide repeat protein [Roseiflexus sp.]|jgi:tetratricopeptide (TPR) repeat protein|nr:tetratricopeptide repeat protein [Roseiflexus sp.]MBO9334916.1 tetratricopeptide repeat protein [Roseiflexus sp.]MBO9341087.1 tetratricopeptide repeat protein [Roseiflexus sp.]MBO9365092.1 tetratricopeptide repeat protein [Roseiflexus sp.]MBO9381532.1 tetratricopeptide repeat protein [Roseiflexus sp.]